METGDVIAICVTSEERSETAPDVPSLKELGVDIVHGQWRALTVPPGTDPAIKAYLPDIFEPGFQRRRVYLRVQGGRTGPRELHR